MTNDRRQFQAKYLRDNQTDASDFSMTATLANITCEIQAILPDEQ